MEVLDTSLKKNSLASKQQIKITEFKQQNTNKLTEYIINTSFNDQKYLKTFFSLSYRRLFPYFAYSLISTTHILCIKKYLQAQTSTSHPITCQVIRKNTGL